MAPMTVEWCNSCNRLVADDAVLVDRRGVRRCPLCRSELSRPKDDHPDSLVPADEHVRAPWHFKLLLAATAVYLVYRTVWIIQRVTHHG